MSMNVLSTHRQELFARLKKLHEEGATIDSIAQELRKSSRTIRRMLKELGLKSESGRKARIIDLNEYNIYAKVARKGMSLDEAALFLNISKRTLYRRLNEYDRIKARTSGVD